MPGPATQACATPPDAGQQVLIVDDSAVARAVMARMIDASDRFAVAGSVASVAAAHQFLGRHHVDIILLDLNMPGGDGLTALPGLIEAGRGALVLVVSSAAGPGAAASVQALALGAVDTLVKPDSQALTSRFAEMLIERLERLGGLAETAASAIPIARVTSPVTEPAPFDLIAIGASTGGIHALGPIMRALPPTLDTPILVTQHLPASFMSYFAAQLAVLAGRPCQVATDRMRVRSGHVYVAPGDAHLRCVRLPNRSTVLQLSREAVASGCMPSVDPMLASAARVYGARLLAIVLSGMGRDGAAGAGAVREAGGAVVIQDQASSVVWGMPGAIATAGHADTALSPEAIGALIAERRRP